MSSSIHFTSRFSAVAQGVPREAPQAPAVTLQHGDWFSFRALQHSLNDLYEATGSCSVQRRPALVVPSVDVAPALHQKLHHLRVFVNASLPDIVKTSVRAQITVPFQQTNTGFWV